MTYSLRRTTLGKDELTAFREKALPAWQRTPEYQRLEALYGKYVYVPMDIPPIKANDPARFKKWFLDTAIPVYKDKADIANPDQVARYDHPTFLSIDSKERPMNPTGWDVNPICTMLEEFPEIKEGLKQLPFDDMKVYTLWSSLDKINPHRDTGPLCDLPYAFRVKLYDENPFETLHLHNGAPGQNISECEKRRVSYPSDTNSFAWNNLRALHSSVKARGLMKVLMLVSPTGKNRPNAQRYEELLKRSLEKYADHVWTDTREQSDYVYNPAP